MIRFNVSIPPLPSITSPGLNVFDAAVPLAIPLIVSLASLVAGESALTVSVNTAAAVEEETEPKPLVDELAATAEYASELATLVL
jgi:hypothetical protein